MKNIMKTLLTVIGIVLAGFGTHILWDGYIQKKEPYKKALETSRKAALSSKKM